jgi:hypothetical protein
MTFEERLNLTATEVGNRALVVNPNLTFSSIFSPDELKIAALKADPELQALARTQLGDEIVDKQLTDFQIIRDRKIPKYDLPPINYDMAVRHPAYTTRLKQYEQALEEGPSLRNLNPFTVNPSLSPGQNLINMKPSEPFGINNAREIASYGIDPAKEIDFDGLIKFKSGLAFGGPRTYTPKQLNYAKNYMGLSTLAIKENPELKGEFANKLPGTFSYVNPSKPELGIRYDEEGKAPVMFDSPLVGGIDFLEFGLQEGPVLAAEIFIGMKGLNRFDDFLKQFPNINTGPIKKIGESVAGNLILAGGAAGTQLIQRFVGASYNAHDMNFTDMLEEAGWIGLLAYGGNQTIDVFLNGVPKIYRAIAGKDVGAAEIKEIRAAIERVRASKKGEKATTVAGKPEEITLLDVDEAIEELSLEIGEDLPKYNPTIGKGSKVQFINDIEQLLISNSSNPKYTKFYNEVFNGNEKTIQKFFSGLFDNLQNSRTANEIGKDLTQRFEANKLDFIEQGNDIVNRLAQSLDNINLAGSPKGVNLLNEVFDEQASSKLYNRFTTEINAASREYKEQLANNVNEAINIPELGGTISAREIRKEMSAFENINKSKLFTAGGKKTENTYYELFSEEARDRLTRYNNGDITLPELNQLRMDLNSYMNTLNPQKAVDQRVFQATKNLQDAIEGEIYNFMKRKIGVRQADEIQNIFQAQKTGTELANQEIIVNLSRQQPESVVNYIFSTNTKNADSNSRVKSLVEFFKKSGNQGQLANLQKRTLDYIRTNFLDLADDTAGNLAANYKTFLQTNKGTLRELFGKDISEFSAANIQKQVIQPIEKLERGLRLAEQRFGTGEPINIVTRILGAGPDQKASGELIDDIKFIEDLVADNAELKTEIADATKSYLAIRLTDADGLFNLNKLDQLLEGGFGSKDLVGLDLSFDGVYGRLLGDESPKFIKNLKVLRDMATRESDRMTSEVFNRAELAAQLGDPQINFLKRMIIPPLTRIGRQTTAIEGSIGQRNQAFLGELLMDEKLFDAYIGAITSRKKINNFIRIANTHHSVMVNDIGNELKYYDPVEKRDNRQPLPTRDTLNIPEEIIKAYNQLVN